MKTAMIAFQLQRDIEALRVRWVHVTDAGKYEHRQAEPEDLQTLIEALQRHAAMLATSG